MKRQKWTTGLGILTGVAALLVSPFQANGAQAPHMEIISPEATEIPEGGTATWVLRLRNDAIYPQRINLQCGSVHGNWPNEWTAKAVTEPDGDISAEAFKPHGWETIFLAGEERDVTLTIGPRAGDKQLRANDRLAFDIVASGAQLPLGTAVRVTGDNIESASYKKYIWRTTGGDKKIDYFGCPAGLGINNPGQTDIFTINVTNGGSGSVKSQIKTTNSTGKDHVLELGTALSSLGFRTTLTGLVGDIHVIAITGESNTESIERINLDFGKGDVYEDLTAVSTTRSFALTFKGTFQPDLLVTTDPAQGYIGSGIYDSNNHKHSQTQTGDVRSSTHYYIKLVNAGDLEDNFILKDSSSHSGWIVRYFDTDNGNSEITTLIKQSEGWTLPSPLLPGESRQLHMVVVPCALNVPVEICMTAQSTSLPIKQDAIQMVTEKQRIGPLRIVKWKNPNQKHAGTANQLLTQKEHETRRDDL